MRIIMQSSCMHFICINIPKLYSSSSMKVIKLTWTLHFNTVVAMNNRCLGVGLSLGPMDARGFEEGLCTEKHTREDEHTRFTQVRGPREEVKPLLLLV